MPTVAENAQLADSLFANLRGSVGRYLDTQSSIAQQARRERLQREMMNLKRAQELEDQRSEAAMRERLANIAVGGQERIEASRATRDDERIKAAQERDDAKAAEAERKARIAAVKAAFAKYQAAGGDKKIKDFGPEDGEETYYAIVADMGEVEKNNRRAAFRVMAETLKSQERALAASVEPDEKEIASITQGAIQSVAAIDPQFKSAVEFYDKAAAKRDPAAALAATRVRFPAFSAALDGQIRVGINASKAEKVKSPEFIKAFQSLNVIKEKAAGEAIKDPANSSEFWNALIDPQKIAAPSGTADLSKVQAGTAKPAPKESAATEQPAPILSPAGIVRDQGPGAALNMLFNPMAMPQLAARQFARYAPAALAGADRIGSSILESVYNLRPVSREKGYATQVGEELGNLIYPSPYKK